MKVLFFSIFQLLITVCHCQTFNVRFDSGGWPVHDESYSIEKTSYGYITSCGTLNVGESDQQISFVGLNESGNVDWIKIYGAANETEYSGWANSMNIINDSILVQGGSIDSDPWLLKLTNTGDTLMSFRIEDTLFNPLYGGYHGWNNQIVGLGSFEQDEDTYYSGQAISLSQSGNLNWHKLYSSSQYSISLRSVVLTYDWGYILGGFTNGPQSDNEFDLIIIKTDSLGNEQWRKKWGDWDDGFAHLVNTSDGNYAVCSWSATEYEIGNVHPPKPYMAKLDTDGEIIWEQRYGGFNYPTYLTKIIETQDGNLVSAGLRSVAGEERGLIIKADAETGDSLWYRVYAFADNVEEPFDCMFRDIIETADGCLVACGYTDPTPGYPSRDTWVMKVDSMGCLVPGCDVSILENTQQANFICYPNPASQYLNTYLQTNTHNIQSAIFNLYNLEGELVKCFEPDESGTTYMLDVSTLASGCYILQYTEDDGILATRRVNVVH